MSVPNRPDRLTVERIAQQEADAAGLPLSFILSSSSPRAVAPRRKALRRIKAETGCSTYGLATVFGCDHGAVLDALRDAPGQKTEPTIYDAATLQRLSWAHDKERVAAIVAGSDPQTNADLAAWRGLGRGL